MTTILIGNPSGPAAFEPDSDWEPEAVQVDDTLLQPAVRVIHWTQQTIGTGPDAVKHLGHRADEFRLTPTEARELATALVDNAERVERNHAWLAQHTPKEEPDE
jgi:hypothetical protein